MIPILITLMILLEMGITNAQPLPSTNDTSNPRLALCPSGDEKAGMIVALMESALSKDGSVVLLDRANVQKVLAEHNLSLAGFLSTDDALKAGQLLQCDIFSELHYEKATNNIAEIVSVVAFDAATGVRLCDEALPPTGSIEEFAKSATRVLLKGVGKWQRKKGPACRTVSLLSVRNVDLPPQMSGITDCLGALVARQILRSPDAAVLERERLDHINREAGLTGDRRDGLLGSTVLLDLDVSARGDNVRVHISMSDMTGKEIGMITVEKKSGEVGQLSEAVVDSMLKCLRLAPMKESTIQGGRSDFQLVQQMEARRFYQQAVFLRGHHDYVRALPPIEAAHALDSANRKYLIELSLLLFDRAFLFLRPASDPEANVNYPYRLEVKTEALDHSLELANRSLDYRLTLLKEVMADPKVADKLYGAVNEIIGQRGLDPYFQEATSAACGNHSETTRSLLAEAQEKALRCILDYSRAAERQMAVKESHLLDFDSKWELEFIGRLHLYCGNVTAEVCLPVIIGIAEEWLSLLEQYGYPSHLKIAYPSHMDPGQTIIGALKSATELGPAPVSKNACIELDHLFQQMENHPFPDIQIHGTYGRMWTESLRRSLSEEEKLTSISTFFNEAKNKISLLPPDVPGIQLLNCYSAVMDYISPIEYETRRRISVELFWIMKARNELFGYVAERTFCDSAAFPAHKKEAFELIEATLGMLTNPACRIVETELGVETQRRSLRNEFEDERANFLLADPSLAKPIKTPWTQERLLFQVEKGETGIRRIACPVVYEGCIYFAGFGGDAKTGEHYVQLIAVSISSGLPHFLKRVKCDWDSKDGFDSDQWYKYVGDKDSSCFSNNRYFLGTCRNGVYSFPVDDGLVEIINSKKGLPSDNVRSMTIMGRELYLSLGDAYLVVYDLEHGESRTLASSRRKEKLSPFDDLPVPFDIPYLVADPARGRILTQVGFNRKQGRDISGLWTIDAKTKTFSLILPLYMMGEWGSGIINDNLILADSFCSILFNCRTDEAKLLNSISSSAAGPTLPFSGNLYGSHRALAPLALVDGWLWSINFLSRISPDGKTQERFPLPGGRKSLYPPCHLELIKYGLERYLLVADQHSLWLLTLPRNAASGSGTSP